MKIDFNEFLRIMTCILIILLIIQGLDYIFGCGVNNYLFIIFCIVFAFLTGSIYHNILMQRKSDSNNNEYKNKVQSNLEDIQEGIDKEYKRDGLTESVFEKQIELNTLRNALDIPDESEIINDEGFVQ